MERRVLIASDSTTDLSPELRARYGVEVLPLSVMLGGQNHEDGVDVTPDQIFEHYERTGELPQTAAVNVGAYAAFFEERTRAGYEIVLFTLSAEMSSSYQNACLAAADYEGVYVVDTRNLSTGGGLLVLEAAELAQAGKPAAEIAAHCTELTGRVDASFVINSLEFLHKGGRCSSVAALGANLFHIKPCIMVRDGKMTVGRKYRGRFVDAARQYIADQLGDGSGIDLTRVFFTHAGCDEELVRACVEQVRAAAPFKEVLVTRAGCTISSHCGRDCLGVLFIRTAPRAAE